MPYRNKFGCFNDRQWSLFFPLAVIFFSLATARTLFTPLLQNQLSAREFDRAFVGFVTGFYELAFLVIFPMSVYIVQSLGSRLMLHYGVFMVGLTFILMGFVENYAPSVVLLCLNFILWILAGIGASFAYMAALALVIASFPGKAAIAYCGLFLFYGAGTVAGPLLGAVAADAGGFVLAYILVGFVVICVSYVVPCCLPQEQRSHPFDSSDTPDELTAIFPSACLKVLKSVSLQVGAIVILATALAFSFLHAALTPFLEQLKLSPIEFGVTYSALHGCALLAVVVVGLLCQRGAPPTLFTLTGLVCMIIGLFFIGPAAFTHVSPPNDDSTPEALLPGYMGIVAFGIGLASVLISVFASFIYAKLDEGYVLTNIAFAHIAWIFANSYAAGAFVGSTFSGLLLAFIGLLNSTVLFIFPLALSLIAVIIHVCCGQPESHSMYRKSATFGVSYGTVEMSDPFFARE